jgi:hypothetical protein
MKSPSPTLRTALASAFLAAASLGTIGYASAQAPAAAPAQVNKSASGIDLTVLPPVPTTFKPKKTTWGEPDFRGMWPIDHLGGLPLQRTPEQGNRVFLNDQEFADREARMEKSRGAAEAETKANKLGMGNWVEMTGAGRRTSLLVSPANGRLPDLTPEGKRLQAAGRSSWVKGQTYDWIDDFDSWDRCVTRGFPASMLPFRYNNGIRIFQSPGVVVIDLEMIHDSRIIYTDGRPPISNKVSTWMGESRGRWEGNTLVIETTNIKTGASPLNMATIGAPPNNTLAMSPQAKVVERLTMTSPETIVYEMTYSDPVMWTAPWTVRLDWQRNDKYKFFEYACHEGNVQFRNYITASRAERAKAAQPAPAAASGAKPKPAGGGQ